MHHWPIKAPTSRRRTLSGAALARGRSCKAEPNPENKSNKGELDAVRADAAWLFILFDLLRDDTSAMTNAA